MEIANSNTYYTPVELRHVEWEAKPATATEKARKAGSGWCFTTPGSGSQSITVFGVKQSFSGNAKIEKGGIQLTKSARNQFTEWLSPAPSPEEVKHMRAKGADDCFAKLTGKLDNPTVEIIDRSTFEKVVNPQMLYGEDVALSLTKATHQAQQL